MELLKLKERLEIATQVGESHFREFKSAFQGPPSAKSQRDIKDVCQDISKTLVAFANADGGELFVGVEDDGTITGIQYDDELINVLLKAPTTYVLKTTPLPTTKALIINYEGKKVLYFSIPKGLEYVYVTSDGKCLKRKDLESIPISPDSIHIEREEIISREYDRAFIDNAKITDLDNDLLQEVAHGFSKTISVEKYLQHLDLAEFNGDDLKLRRAALLLFAKNPLKWHPRLQVRILKVKGTKLEAGKNYNVLNDETVSGNILTIIESAWDKLRPFLTETKMSSDAMFKTQIIYPDLACKEALINAIAHRDYSIEGRGIEVYVYDDRLEIKSPGMLLSTIKIDDLEKCIGIHQSRNSYIAKVLKEVGYMRELGEGFRRIYELMESHELLKPTLFNENKSFTISFSQKLVYTEDEKIWLDNFKSLDLSREERAIIRLGAKGELLSPKQIWDTVGIVDTDVYRSYIEKLRKKGVLVSEISKTRAVLLAKKTHKDKKSIPRFRIIIPKNESEKMNIQAEPLDSSDYAKIFVENVHYDCQEEDIFNEFSKFGEIDSVIIPRDRTSKKGKGFAYVEFSNNDSVQLALEYQPPIFIKNRKIRIKKYKRNIKSEAKS